MRNDKSVPVHYKSVALAVHGKFFHHVLNALKLDIKRDDVLTVRKHSAYGNDNVARLRINIRRNERDLTVALFCYDIPVTCGGIPPFRRFPVKTVHVPCHDDAIQSGKVLVKLLLNVCRLFDQEFVYPRGCTSRNEHMIDRVGSDMQDVLRGVQMIVDH